MLTFCIWEDEDGTHYGVTNESPRKFFNWHRWRDCFPKTCVITSEEAAKLITPRDSDPDPFKYVDIKDWEYYFDVIRPRLLFLR